MSLFPPPDKLPTGVTVAWSREAKPGFGNPKLIHDRFWKPFNTVTIPLLSPAEFYADALAAARDSQTLRELEQTLEEKFQLRREELAQSFETIRKDASRGTEVGRAARDAGKHGSLSSFARAVGGLVFGWDQVHAGDFALNLDYLLPRNHWKRTRTPEHMAETQVDPFHALATMFPNYDDPNDWYITPDEARGGECSSTVDNTLQCKSRLRARASDELQDTSGHKRTTSQLSTVETQPDVGRSSQIPVQSSVFQTSTALFITEEPVALKNEKNIKHFSSSPHDDEVQTANRDSSDAEKPQLLDCLGAISPSNTTANHSVSAHSSVTTPPTSPPADSQKALDNKSSGSEKRMDCPSSNTRETSQPETAIDGKEEAKPQPRASSRAKKRSFTEMDKGERRTSGRHSKRRIYDASRVW